MNYRMHTLKKKSKIMTLMIIKSIFKQSKKIIKIKSLKINKNRILYKIIIIK